MKKLLLEIEIEGLQQYLYQLQENLLPTRLDTCTEIFVYAVLQEGDEPDEFQKITLDGYDAVSKVENVIWALAKLCPPANYWLIADLRPPDINYWMQEGVLSPDILKAALWDPKYSAVLLRLHKNQRLPLDPDAGGYNHARVFRFLALPSNSSDNLLLERVYQSPSMYKINLYKLIFYENFVLSDTVLEVFPYGEEEVDYVGIKLTPWLSREQVREVVQGIYQLPYYKVRRSVEQFMFKDDTDWINLTDWGISL